MTYAYLPAYSEGTTEKTTEDTETRKTTNSDAPHDAEEDKSKKTGGRPKGNIMKNDTFNQIINANLASIDPARPVRTRQGLLRPDEEGPSTSKAFPDSNESHSGLPRFPTDHGSPFFV